MRQAKKVFESLDPTEGKNSRSLRERRREGQEGDSQGWQRKVIEREKGNAFSIHCPTVSRRGQKIVKWVIGMKLDSAPIKNREGGAVDDDREISGLRWKKRHPSIQKQVNLASGKRRQQNVHTEQNKNKAYQHRIPHPFPIWAAERRRRE